MKTTAQMIEVMQAWQRGETIEVRDIGEKRWGTLIDEPSWNWIDSDYRIKPREPRVIWVNEYSDRSILHSNEEIAKQNASDSAKRIAVKYVEAIE